MEFKAAATIAVTTDLNTPTPFPSFSHSLTCSAQDVHFHTGVVLGRNHTGRVHKQGREVLPQVMRVAGE